MGNLGKRLGEPFLPVEEASSKSLCGFLLDRRATWNVCSNLSLSLNSCQSQSEVKQKHLSHQKSFLRLKLQPSLLKLWLMQRPSWSLQQQLGLQSLLLRLWWVIISCLLEGQPAVCFHYNSPKADCLYKDWKIGSAFKWSFGTTSVSSCIAGVGLSRWM